MIPIRQALAFIVWVSALALGPAPSGSAAEPFGPTTVIDLARQASTAPFAPPENTLPSSIEDLAYDDYQAIQFRRELAIGRDLQLPIWVELFHRGLLYRDRIEIAEVHNGIAETIPYSAGLFRFGPYRAATLADGDIGFSGLRLLGPLTVPGVQEEFAVFQGASYFRGIGSGQSYGLSARGLALSTDRPGSEEFPVFRKFWVERPVVGDSDVVVHALLDSPSVAGAYRFVVRPGLQTTMEIEATLFPRVDLTHVGLAPGTSMFAFNSNRRTRVDDYRPEVHDSDGLLIREATGSYLWRPLDNPRAFSTTRFPDDSPSGFGLMQRARDFENYQDLWAHYERRPSLWIEPIGDWGKGAVTLVEIPTGSEFHDNIVAYWEPQAPIAKGSEYTFKYRASWNGEPPRPSSMTVSATRIGQVLSARPIPNRQFMIDFTDWSPVPGVATPSPSDAEIAPSMALSSSAGQVGGLLITKLPSGGWRVGFQLDPESVSPIDLRLSLTFADGRKAEGWAYRWTRD